MTHLLAMFLRGSQLAIVLMTACLPIQASAQAGPPLITNDPDTPGDGHWEINLAAAGAHGRDGWEIAEPDLDINYGLGERIQLSMHASWNHQRPNNEPWQSGAGPVELAVRWRFVDEERAGFSLAIQPHWASSWSAAARRRGLAPANDEFALPIQAARHFGNAIAGIEIGRNFIAHEPDEWQAGVFYSQDCPLAIRCLFEINAVSAPGSGPETVVNFGARRNINEHLVLLASLGRQFSSAADSRQTVFYLGLQFLR
jgi:hypothetical protein